MGSSIFSIGLTGLNAAQAGLVTTSHNIANAGTDGYSRQNTVQSTNPAMFTGAGFFGEGTRVDTVKRAYSAFLTNQVLAADTKYSEYDAYNTEISQIDNMLADSSAGLTPALESFFGGVQEVAANPSSIPARQSMVSTAQSLVARFRNLSDRLDEVRAGVESQIDETVSQISSYAQQIAEVNHKIVVAQQAGSSQPANDLLDARDQLVQELNQLVRVSTNASDDGALSVFIGTGQPLVIGTTATTLDARPSLSDPTRLDVNIIASNGNAIAIPESLLGGGKLGGFLSMRANSLDVAQNQLGLVAVGISSTFNAQHALGQDLNGNLGTDFFSSPSIAVTRNALAATSFGAGNVSYADVSKLTGDDYKLTFTDTAGGYKLTRLSDGVAVQAADVGLAITQPATSMVGDSFLIQPTRYAAGNLEVAISDTRMIAAAAPLIATAGQSGMLATLASSSAATLSAPTVYNNDRFAAYSAANSVFTYNGGTGALDISGLPSGTKVGYTTAAGVTVAPSATSSIPYSAGMTISLWHADGTTGVDVQDVGFTVGGSVAAGDSFLLRGGAANTGSASVTAPVMQDLTNISALRSASTTLGYNGSSLQLNGLPSGMVAAYTPLNGSLTLAASTTIPYSSGMQIAFGHLDTSGQFVSETSFSISGAPTAGDTFVIGANSAGVADGRNAVLLGNLQTTKTLLTAAGQPSATYQSVYSQLVSTVGNKARELQVNRDAQLTLADQAKTAQQSLVGVNLDEEAANLIRYQQAYQAASKVMSIASKLFDQVLALGQ